MDPLSREEAARFLSQAPVAHIGVIANGEPYVTPLSFVLDDERILFRTQPGQRFEAMAAEPRVSIEASTFDTETGEWISVIVRGTATETTDSATMSKTVKMLFQKYEKALGSPLTHGAIQPLAAFPHIVEVEILEITGMSSGRGFSPRTRPGRL